MPQENWNDQGVSDDNKTYVTEKNWASNDAMVTSMRDLEAKVSGSIVLPAAGASDDDLSAFYKQLGRPDNASGYGYKMPEGGNEEYHKWFTNSAHKVGLSDTQAQALGSEWDKKNKEIFDNNTLSVEKEVQAVKEKYGADYDSKVAKGKAVVQGLGLDNIALAQIEKHTGTGVMADLFIRIGEKIGEGGFLDKDADPNISAAMSKTQATEALDVFDHDEAKQKLFKAGDKKTVAYRKQLYQIIYD